MTSPTFQGSYQDIRKTKLGGAGNLHSTLGENFRSGQELPRPARGIN